MKEIITHPYPRMARGIYADEIIEVDPQAIQDNFYRQYDLLSRPTKNNYRPRQTPKRKKSRTFSRASAIL